MRAMVLGAGGLLGSELIATAPHTLTVLPFTRQELDITDTRSLERSVRDTQPDVIVNAGAYTAVDRAESERDLAYAVNETAVGAIGRVAADCNARVIHFSTDYVFDGLCKEAYDEQASPNPISVYGRSKLGGEIALRQTCADFLIIRTQWLFGPKGRCFPATMWDRASSGQPSRVVSDQLGRPSHAEDIARVCWELTAKDARGVLHVANSGTASWYDVAYRLYAALGMQHLLQQCLTTDYPTSAKRPLRSLLATNAAERMLGYSLPTWESALDRFIAAKKSD